MKTASVIRCILTIGARYSVCLEKNLTAGSFLYVDYGLLNGSSIEHPGK